MQKKINFIAIFKNGNVAVCDTNGEQVAELQGNIFLNIFEKARQLGYDIDDNVEMEIQGGLKFKKVKGFDNIEVF
jgi:hypothetical protein